jgi:hypothetical protein
LLQLGSFAPKVRRGTALKSLMILAAAAGAAMTLISGVADAQGSPSVSGKKFSEASTTLQQAGYTVKVSTMVGDQVPQSDCIVTSQQDSAPAAFGPSQFNLVKDKTVLLSLNCNAGMASPTGAGYSAASPEGRAVAAKELQSKVEWERTAGGQAWCEQNKAQHADWDWETDPHLAGCKSAG